MGVDEVTATRKFAAEVGRKRQGEPANDAELEKIERQLETATRRLESPGGGRESIKTILDFQEDLTRLRQQELQAVTRYKKAIVQLDLANGSKIREFFRHAPLPAGYGHLED